MKRGKRAGERPALVIPMHRRTLFRRLPDDAVSPVIAVILMVAITVVLAATVYVWVSGFGSQTTQASKSVSLTSNGPLGNGGWKNYTVASGTPGMTYGGITITVNGVSYPLDTAANCGTSPVTVASGKYAPCAGTTAKTASSVVNGGDVLSFKGLSAGQTLRVIDANADSVILTLTVG